MSMSAGSRLKNALDSLEILSKKKGLLWGDPRLRKLYPRYLVSLYSAIKTSVPLMAQARDIALERADLHPANKPLAEYLDKHIEEELDHDEWLLDDLEVIGVPRRVATDCVPSPTVAALVGSQYYYLHAYRPAALLGYLGRLEHYPPTDEQIETMIRGSGHPREAFRCLLVHADKDPHHSSELFEVVDELPLDEDDITSITTNAMATSERCAFMIHELVSEDPITFLPGEQV